MKKAKRQIHQLTLEFRRLSDKRPNDVVNQFKLELVNAAIDNVNSIIQGECLLTDFDQFNTDLMPVNSDVLLVLSLYDAELNSSEYDHL